jgi:hypothetical protein
MREMFEDTKEVSRSRKLKKDIQYNGQKKKRQKKQKGVNSGAPEG